MPVSAVGVEYEYKWRVDALADGWAPEEPERGDAIVEEILRSAAPALGGEHGELHTFAQSALYFDTAAWDLAERNLSLAGLVNYGAMTGTGWLVLKETVRWAGHRRDALEVAESLDTRELAKAMTEGQAEPLRRASQRLGNPLPELVPFGKVVQRRRKVLWRLGEGLALGLTLDSSRLSATGTQADAGTPTWWFEIEANSGDQRALNALAHLASAADTVLGSAPSHTTKPQLAARIAGWQGSRA
ncbi:hypothetical protein [Kitasatospora sp. NPDC057936]|uniref:hypothetical protein n=1 Tax=Kitasatospora sp. NPDC057936 TaxID=3346283 RepID=UPI0036D817B7